MTAWEEGSPSPRSSFAFWSLPGALQAKTRCRQQQHPNRCAQRLSRHLGSSSWIRREEPTIRGSTPGSGFRLLCVTQTEGAMRRRSSAFRPPHEKYVTQVGK